MRNNFDIKKNIKLKTRKAFTLFEVVLALIIFSMLVGIIFTAYINIKKAQGEIGKQQIIVQESNDFLDRLHELSLDYTIDYEEYFNRTQSNCLSGSIASRNTGGACDIFTNYGNTGDIVGGGRYYCDSSGDFDMSASGYQDYQFSYQGGNPNGCAQSGKQYFGQYKRQFRDTVDQYLNNGDDTFTGRGPIAISQNTGVQELYLINNDGDQRVLFRRKFITGVDLNGDGFLTGKNESLYTIQTLRLRGGDAGINHDFDLSPANRGAYDGFIDTRACDYGKGFSCGGGEIPGYPNYKLPKNEKDGRENITDPKITVSDRNFEIYPAKDPYFATKESNYLIDPFIKVSLTVNLYGVQTDDEITLQTSLGFKNSYSNFDILDLDEVEVGTGGGIATGTFCGDGDIDMPNSSGFNEECDDGNILTGDGCNDICLRETQLAKCDDANTLPAHSQANTAIQIIQTCDNSNGSFCTLRLPSVDYYYNSTPSTGECRFICDTGYNYNNITEECDPIVFSTGDFVTIWKTDNFGSSSDTEITIPTNPSYTYDYDVDCDNDGTWDANNQIGNYTCGYASTGIYTVRIRGLFPAIYFNNVGDKEKILSVSQWGNGSWSSMTQAFHGCSKLGSIVTWASDNPNLTNVTDMSNMFRGAAAFNKPIGSRDTSNIQTINGMLSETILFNQPLNTRNTSNITDMALAFNNASNFNQDLSSRNTSNVTSMFRMFDGASSFNQNINSRDVSNVTNMSRMFFDAVNFNSLLKSRNIGNVTNMSNMFRGASSFNNELRGGGTNNVTNMSYMFLGAASFNQNISTRDTSNVTSMAGMFFNADNFNQNISVRDTSSVTNMYTMLYDINNFSYNIGLWDINNITDMENILANTTISTSLYDSILSGWYNQPHKTGVTLGVSSNYCTGETARSGLLMDNWNISDRGKDCS